MTGTAAAERYGDKLEADGITAAVNTALESIDADEAMDTARTAERLTLEEEDTPW